MRGAEAVRSAGAARRGEGARAGRTGSHGLAGSAPAVVPLHGPRGFTFYRLFPAEAGREPRTGVEGDP